MEVVGHRRTRRGEFVGAGLGGRGNGDERMEYTCVWGSRGVPMWDEELAKVLAATPAVLRLAGDSHPPSFSTPGVGGMLHSIHPLTVAACMGGTRNLTNLPLIVIELP